MITLYRKNRLGVGSWSVYSVGNVLYINHANVVGGSEVTHTETVPAGLAGRTLEEQIKSRIESRVNRQRDKGYVDTIEEAMSKPLTNMLGMPPPMLAKKINDMRAWPGKSVAQAKLDGFRCIATRDEAGKVLLYSRQGKPLDALAHIAERLEQTLPEGTMLDGELYLHGVNLQTIASWAKRLQPDTSRLVYHVYDSISEDTFPYRYAEAKDVVQSCDSERIVMVKNHIIKEEGELWEIFSHYRDEGYEGAMLRTLATPYESGTRSSSLFKVKARHDSEYRVVDVVPGSDGCGILVCQLPNGGKFKTLAPGNHDQKKFVLAHKDQYIGRKVTVEYANLTSDGVPFHSVAIRFKDDL